MILEAKDLKLQYGNEVIINELNFFVQRPQIISIIGPNGSGKSTLLKSLGRLLTPSSGTVLLDGREIHNLPSAETARKLAILPQSAAAPPDMTVYDLVKYGRMPYQGFFTALNDEDRAAIDEALRAVGLSLKQNRCLDALSGGERQRAWLALALAQQPEILLLDEPTTYLDIHHQLELMQLIQKLHYDLKITVIMVLHDLNHAARFSHRLVAVKDGCILADGAVDEVFTSANIRQLYNVENSIMRLNEGGVEHLVCLLHDVAVGA